MNTLSLSAIETIARFYGCTIEYAHPRSANGLVFVIRHRNNQRVTQRIGKIGAIQQMPVSKLSALFSTLSLFTESEVGA